jgi:hypothetical protein
VAGDGIGILVTAAIVAHLGLAKAVDLGLECAVGFAFGWTIFQALFMRSMAGSYAKSLRSTLVPEFLSMNGVMAGMMAVSVTWMAAVAAASNPSDDAIGRPHNHCRRHFRHTPDLEGRCGVTTRGRRRASRW